MSPADILQKYWGYPAFRPLQSEIIQSVLEGRDTLALLPTGGGKSLCYQVPALCLEGITIVVSPLIALMKDQVHNLERRGVPAAAIHAGMNRRTVDIIFENACNGAYKLLYLSPERLQTEMAVERIKRMNVSLLAVDEAHCVSQWGYDFRPPYLQIADFRKNLPGVPVVALTATATGEVMKDIQEKLAFTSPQVFRQSFLRENLSYSVLYEDKKRDKLLDILKNVPGSGIVYARTRGETKEIANFLHQNRVSAGFYHAGLTTEERSARQDAWMEGKIRIIVCTNAFGMGIDKPDVRVVVHLYLPDSLEAYFQEAGRGGRDGKRSYSTLLYSPGDGLSLAQFLEASFPPLEVVRRTYQALGSMTQLAIGAGAGESFDFDFNLFCSQYKLDHAQTHAALRLLEQEGWISLSDAPGTPPRVQVPVSREVIYDYQLRNPQADTVIKALLRAHPGLQNNLVNISEGSLAQYAKTDIEKVRKVLEAAHTAGVLYYEPQRDKPQIVFTRERMSAENLELDVKKFRFRRERAEERVKQAIRYAEERRCRSQLLLAYFGEQDSKPCGICDICTGRNKRETDTDEFISYARKIKDLLRHESLTAAQILESFAMKRQETVARVLAYMLDEGELEQNQDGGITLV